MVKNSKRLLISVLIFNISLFSLTVKSQILKSSSLNEEIKKDVYRFQTPNYLSEEEAEAFYFTNVFRLYPQYFLDSILIPYAELKELTKSRYYKSLIKEMQKSEPLQGFTYRNDLHQVAKTHAVQNGKSGKTGHQNFDKRFLPYRNNFSKVGENCAYGEQSGLDFLIQLLIDEDVPDLGHRKNLFESEFNSIGNSIQYHKSYKLNYVQCFGSIRLKN